MESIFAQNRTALITGALAGIGFELARVLAPKLDTLVVIARRAERLNQLVAGTGVVVSEAAPRPVESEFDQVAGIEGGATPGQGIFRISARECAEHIVREFEKGTPVIFPGRSYRWLMKAQPLLPRRLVARQMAQAARKIRTGTGKKAA